VKRKRTRLPASSKRTPRRPRPAPTRVTFEHVRTAARALPGVEDGTSYGTPALKVCGKLLARIHQSIDCFVLRADFLDRQIMLQSAPSVFFITEHYRDYPWVLVRFSAVRARELPDLIERAWRLVAPKMLVKNYDAGRGGRHVVRQSLGRRVRRRLRSAGSGLSQLLRFPGSVERDPAIEAWMQEHSGELGVIGFFRGAEILDAEGLLQGSGKFMRHVKLKPEQHSNATALKRLIETAYADMKRRVHAGAAR
jgi:hypothetical protein